MSLWPSGSLAGFHAIYVPMSESSRWKLGGGCICYYYHAITDIIMDAWCVTCD